MIRHEYDLKKAEDCIYCICLECHKNTNTIPGECPYSDCKWCYKELGNYTEDCGKFEEKEKENA